MFFERVAVKEKNMAKLNDIRALAESHAAEISRSVQAWTGYLDTAATLYRYDFPETLLIHAQRPDATACAEMEIWNNRMKHRCRKPFSAVSG